MADVVVAGAGPAGWAVAAECARRGLHAVLVDPRPRAGWPAVYGMWADECGLLPEGSRWVQPAATRVVATSERVLPRGYAVLDNDTVLAALTSSDVELVADRAVSASRGSRGSSVVLASGRVLATALVIDATGARRVLSGGPARPPRAEQTAYGLIVPCEAARPLVDADSALFMDWRPAPGCAGAEPTFLYAVPLPGRRTLLEETSLARRPGLGIAELRGRLRARLAAHGIQPDGRPDRVRIPLDVPPPRIGPSAVIAFGAAAALVHPATGYSVAETFRLAPRVAEAIASTLPAGPAAAIRAARHAVWPPAARAVQLLRRRGLATLLALPPERLPTFFELFFALPADLQRAYLAGREDLAGTAAAMAAIFRSSDRSMRVAVARHALLPPPLR